MSYIIKENRESTYISYTLNNENDFFDVGYKVLQNQVDNGFVKCNKITHNGKVKLLYDISRYKDLETLVHSASTDNLIKVLIKLFKVVIDVKENGFIEYKNINTNLNTIFVDPNNLTIKMIYIPINIENGRNEKVFLEELRANILEAINNSIHNGVLITKLRAGLNKGDSFQDILSDLSNYNSKDNFNTYENNNDRSINNNEKTSTNKDNISEKNISKKKDNSNKKSYISSFSSLFFKKNKVKDIKEEVKDNNDYNDYDEYDDYYEETTLIDDFEVKKIKIKGIDSPSEINIVIDKDYFILGSSYNTADGVISFNKAISRKHCAIRKNGDKYYLTDLGSSNGTFVNGVKLLQGDSIEIKAGDKIKLANSAFSIENT